MTATECGLQILRVGRHLGRATLPEHVVGSFTRRRPRADVREPCLERRVLGSDEEFFVAVGPHSEMARREELQLQVELASGLVGAPELLSRLLRFAGYDSFDVLVLRFLAVPKDRDIDALAAPALRSEPVARSEVLAIETVAFNELTQDLLYEPVLGRGCDLLAGEEVDQRVRAARLVVGLFIDLVVDLVAHFPGSRCFFRKAR